MQVLQRNIMNSSANSDLANRWGYPMRPDSAKSNHP